MQRTVIATAFLVSTASAQAGLIAGDIAIIGRINNGSPDSFAFVTLADIAAGETVYFTDNGWTGTQFRGSSATDGDGNENLLKWTANNAVTAGTIIGSLSSSPDWTFTNSGSIPGTTSGSFGNLALAGSGDQIYAFQGPTSNPLFNPSQHVFVFDDTNAFENASDSNTGNITPGLTLGTTALTFNFASSGFAALKATALTGSLTKDQWLAVFADASNWQTGASGTLPSGSISVTPVPVPAALPLFGSALVALGALHHRRRRTTAHAEERIDRPAAVALG